VSPTSSVGLFCNNGGFAAGSCDGRANLSNLSREGINFKSSSIMTFKCHKTEEGKNQVLYPVNSLGFNPRSNVFLFTAGGDGMLNFWDHKEKNKIKTFSFKGLPVTKGKVSHDGQMVAYGLGYDWQKGIWGLDQNVKPRIVVHVIPD